MSPTAGSWGSGLPDPVPHFTTPGKNYSRRWKDSGLFEEFFDHVVKPAIDCGYIDRRMIFTHTSHLKANAAALDCQRRYGGRYPGGRRQSPGTAPGGSSGRTGGVCGHDDTEDGFSPRSTLTAKPTG